MNSVIEHLRVAEREAFADWLKSDAIHVTAAALKWHKALEALTAELEARARLAA